MRTCPSCARENPLDRDFCECGEYLRWEPTSFVEAVKPGSESSAASEEHDPNATIAPSHSAREPAPQASLAPGLAARASPPVGAPVGGSEAPPGVATLLLRLPEDDGVPESPIRLEVDPGGRVTMLGLIRNQGAIVDNYDLAIDGLPDGWWTVTPATAYLVPYGTSGSYEQEIQIHLHPPCAPEATARAWSIEVTAQSRAYGSQVASAAATLVILPYQDVAAELRPDRASGRLKARFVLTVRNRANAPADVLVAGQDTDGECRFRFAEPSVAVQPGEAIEAPFTVFPPRQLWIGRPTERRIQVAATPVGSEQPQAPRSAIYRQRAWLPWWLTIVAPIAALLIVALILLLPKQTKVPDLTKAASVFAAQKLLNDAGLKLSPQVNQTTSPGAAPGTIVDQSPAAGKHVKKGSFVSIQVAMGSGTDTVPSVIGLTPVSAEPTLRAAGVALGVVSPQPVDPNGKIASQIPPANETVPGGTPVSVFLAPSSSSLSKAAAAGAAGAAAGAVAAKGNGAGVVLPAIRGTPAVAAAQLSQLGLVPVTATRFSGSAPGSLIGSQPPAGTRVQPGASVRVLVSAGFPELSYDDGRSIHIVNGASGKSAAAAPGSTQAQEEASWSIDGSHLVYRQGNELILLQPNKPGAQPFALTGPGTDDHDPAFAPTMKANILAYIERRSDGGHLCLATVGPNLLSPDCTGHPGWDLGRQVAWSPDGASILVFGVKVGHPETFGLIEFVSNVPFSTHASDWGPGTLVSDDSRANQGVIAGAFSPDGKQLAFVANPGGSGFHLYLAAAHNFELTQAKALPTAACEVSWRSDGQQLAVMQADSPCQDPTGNIVTIAPANPTAETVIATGAAHPAWQPVTLHG